MFKNKKMYTKKELESLSDDDLKRVAREQLTTLDFLGKDAKENILEELIRRYDSKESELDSLYRHLPYTG